MKIVTLLNSFDYIMCPYRAEVDRSGQRPCRMSYLCIVKTTTLNYQFSILNFKLMPVFYKTFKNQNTASKTYGQFYGRVVTTKTMTYPELCKHMSEHNSIYGEDVCLGVANKLQSCILEQLLEGKKVQFGDLGVFYLAVKSTGSSKEEDFNAGQNIKGLYLRFAPNRQDVNDLSSKTLKKKASFMNAKDLTETKAKESGDVTPEP